MTSIATEKQKILELKHEQQQAHLKQNKQISQMLKEFNQLKEDLMQQIKIENNRTQITDPNHFAFSPISKLATQRIENINSSISKLTELDSEEKNILFYK